MSAKTKKEDAVAFLAEKAPHLSLLEWAGSASGKSTFHSSITGRTFSACFSQMKNDLKKGNKVGVRYERDETSLVHHLKQWLSDNLPHMQLVSAPETASTPLVLFHTKLQREVTGYTFSSLKHFVRQGKASSIGIGHEESTRRGCKRVWTAAKVEDWLTHNAPHIQLLSWGGASSVPSLFVNNLHDMEFVAPFGRLKMGKKRGEHLRGLGAGGKLPSRRAQAALDRCAPGRFTLIEYKGKGMLSRYRDNDTGTEFEKDHASFIGYLRHQPLFSPTEQGTSIELVMKEVLDRHEISYMFNKSLKRLGGDSSTRPDFILDEYGLVIECDGLYWHSDAQERVDRGYHIRRKQQCESLGMRVVAFYEDEIINKLPIVGSIILNACKLTPHRIFARKCSIQEIKPDFFEQNHLMGKGAGRCYGLVYEGEVVAGMQVKWVKKKDNSMEISRFCLKNNHTVVGGFSKLLNHVEKTEKPSTIQTFVDQRYGDGSYLSNLGFEHKGTHVSFNWVKDSMRVHRMKFPGNSGYEQGFSKLWDYGQAKWVRMSFPHSPLNSAELVDTLDFSG